MAAAPRDTSVHNRCLRGRRLLALAAAAFLLGGFLASPVAAAPSTDDVCKGSPVEGATIRGPVLHVLDSQTICVALGFDPSRWIPMRVADAPTATTRATLMAVAFGKNVDCVVGADMSARCSVDGQSVGTAAAAPEMIEAGRAWRESRAVVQARPPARLASE
jgi:hypothetical protein